MWIWTMILCVIMAGTVPALYDVAKAIREVKQCEAQK